MKDMIGLNGGIVCLVSNRLDLVADTARKELATLIEAAKMLKEAEWKAEDEVWGEICWSCLCPKERGHAPSCRLDAILKRLE